MQKTEYDHLSMLFCLVVVEARWNGTMVIDE